MNQLSLFDINPSSISGQSDTSGSAPMTSGPWRTDCVPPPLRNMWGSSTCWVPARSCVSFWSGTRFPP